MKRYILENNLQDSGKRFVATVSGANMNFSRLRFVSERSELGQKREVLLMVEIPERPGSFLRLAQKIFPRQLSEFSYRYSGTDTAQIFLSFLLDTPPGGAASTPAPGTTGPSTEGMPVPPAAADAGKPHGTASSTSDTPARAASPPTDPSAREAAVGPLDLATAVQRSEVQGILDAIHEDDMDAVDISDNEVAKAHARYMVGGQCAVPNERLFQFGK